MASQLCSSYFLFAAPDHDNRYFTSRTFILAVGTEAKEYVAHQGILFRSPVFQAMLKSNFREATSGVIKLPEDCPVYIGCLLEYLYGNAIDTTALAAHPWATLHGVYAIAEKYQVKAMQPYILEVMGSSPKDPVVERGFFEESQWLYSRIPESDTVFRLYFKKRASAFFLLADASSLPGLNRWLQLGGPFAQDLFQGLLRSLKSSKEKKSRQNRRD